MEKKRNWGPFLIILAGCFWGSMGIFVRRLTATVTVEQSAAAEAVEHAVGIGRRKRDMAEGDVFEVEIEKLGVLRNSVRRFDALER